MKKNSEPIEVFSVQLSTAVQRDIPLYIGEMCLRNRQNSDAGYFGKLFITDTGTHTFTVGQNREDIEKNSKILGEYTIDYLEDDIRAFRMFKIADDFMACFN